MINILIPTWQWIMENRLTIEQLLKHIKEFYLR